MFPDFLVQLPTISEKRMKEICTFFALISSSSSWNLLLMRPNKLMFCWSSHVTSVSTPSPCHQNHSSMRAYNMPKLLKSKKGGKHNNIKSWKSYLCTPLITITSKIQIPLFPLQKPSTIGEQKYESIIENMSIKEIHNLKNSQGTFLQKQCHQKKKTGYLHGHNWHLLLIFCV